MAFGTLPLIERRNGSSRKDRTAPAPINHRSEIILKFLKRVLRAGTRTSTWTIPLTYAATALICAILVPRFYLLFFSHISSTISVNSAIAIYSSVASGMMALTSMVFALTFLMVQFSATVYSPRLVVWIARDPVVSHALGVFIATFVYALAALAWVDRMNSGRVPLLSLSIVVSLVVASIFMFISLLHRLGTLQVNRILIFVGDKGREVIEDFYPPVPVIETCYPADPAPAACRQTLLHRGNPRILQRLNLSMLVQIASRGQCIIEMAAAVGDALFDASPILRVLGGNVPLSEHNLREAIELGDVRTFEQDPKYAIRLIVDIAIRALSQAVNDPTTAVQALDQIEDLLIRLGRRRLETGKLRDAQGNLRLLITVPTWDDFLRLALDEVRFYGANSVQVMRRMKALLSELISLLPQSRQTSVMEWQTRLQMTVDRSFPVREDKAEASTEDRQGMGMSRSKTAGI